MKQTLSAAIDDFMAHRRSLRRAPGTLKNDAMVLRSFMSIEYGPGNILVENVRPHHVDAYFSHAAETRPNSLKIDHAVLTTFFRWCIDNRRLGRYGINPMVNREAPLNNPREWRGIRGYQFPALLDAAWDPDKPETPGKYPAHRMLLTMGLFLLGRAMEVSKIRLADVDLDAGLIQYKVLTKTRRHQKEHIDEIKIVPELDATLRVWLPLYEEACGKLKPHWFVVPRLSTPRGRHAHRWTPGSSVMLPEFYMKTPHHIAQAALESIGFEIRKPSGESWREGMHTLRRSGARFLYEELVGAGVPNAIQVVQSTLHHSDEKQTRHYIGVYADREIRNKVFEGFMYPSLQNVTPLKGPSQWALTSNPAKTLEAVGVSTQALAV